MGYTRYWARTEKPITQEFVNECIKIIQEAEQKGITLCGWDGEGKPKVTLDEIRFNGKAPHMDHETFCITNEKNDIGFGFCKTARKPYDYVVKRILKVAKDMGNVTNVNSDGENEMRTDQQYLDTNGIKEV